MTLNENVNSAADDQKAKLADGVAGEGVALSDEDLEQVSGGSIAEIRDLPSTDLLVSIDVPTDPTKIPSGARRVL